MRYGIPVTHDGSCVPLRTVHFPKYIPLLAYFLLLIVYVTYNEYSTKSLSL